MPEHLISCHYFCFAHFFLPLFLPWQHIDRACLGWSDALWVPNGGHGAVDGINTECARILHCRGDAGRAVTGVMDLCAAQGGVRTGRRRDVGSLGSTFQKVRRWRCVRMTRRVGVSMVLCSQKAFGVVRKIFACVLCSLCRNCQGT